MNKEELVYKVQGKYWDVELAEYVSVPASGKEVVELFANGLPADEAYLAQTLAFYGYPLGELVMLSPQGIKEKLAALDAEYLTPRVLAGLATGDAYALERWQEHEAQAAPLREGLGDV